MKKIVASLILLALLLVGFVSLSSPAQASDTATKATICHATDKGFEAITVSKKSIVKKNGEEGGHGDHESDIIPPFPYNFGGNDNGDYPGKNWVSDAVGNQFIANGCSPHSNPLTPNLATPTVQATCMDLTGASSLVIPAQNTGVTVADPVLNSAKTSWTLDFSKTANTIYETYIWNPATFTGQQIIRILPPLTTDPLWDLKTGKCNLPDTGASGFSTSAIVWAGGLLFAGLIFLGLTNFIGNRRKS